MKIVNALMKVIVSWVYFGIVCIVLVFCFLIDFVFYSILMFYNKSLVEKVVLINNRFYSWFNKQ